MARAIGQPKILDSPVRDVMDPPFPVVDGESPVALLTTLLSRTTPAALVRRNGKVMGIVTRYDCCISWRASADADHGAYGGRHRSRGRGACGARLSSLGVGWKPGNERVSFHARIRRT